MLAAEASAAGNLATTATGAPLRTAFVCFPNGAIQSTWWPKEEGKDHEFSATLKPLEQQRQHLQILGGLDHKNAEAGPDGAGDHARGNGTFLTGVRLKKSATDIRAGISIDQLIAREIGHLTRFASLELTCDASRNSGACDSGYACAYQYNISWSSPTTPMAPVGPVGPIGPVAPVAPVTPLGPCGPVMFHCLNASLDLQSACE
jgi:hypothetical protein